MQLRYTVTVDVDPGMMTPGQPSDVVRDEIKSNLESVDYVTACDVTSTPLRGGSHGRRAQSGRGR